MAMLMPNGKQQFDGVLGLPLVGGRVYTYAAGTNTPQATFADAAGSIPNTNPVVLDARGEATIFWAGTYKIVLRDVFDNLIWTIDNVTTINPLDALFNSYKASLLASTGAGLVGFVGSDAGAVPYDMLAKARQIRTVEDFGAVGDGVADDTVAIQAAFDATVDGDKLLFTRPSYLISATITAPNNGASIDFQNALVTAKAGVSFENMFQAVGRDRLTLRGGEIDANGPNRAAGQLHRFMAIVLTNCTRCDLSGHTVRNVRGYNGIPGVGITLGGTGAKNVVSNCRVEDCGVTNFAADGVYCSTDDSQIISITAERVTDTAVVLESCNNSLVLGGMARECSVAAAITNAVAAPKRGNRVLGMVAYDLRSDVTGWVQVSALGTGNLIDTHVDIKISSSAVGFGGGPAINVRQPSSGKVIGVHLAGSVYNPTAQGILIAGTDITVAMRVELLNTTEAAVYWQPGSSGTMLGADVIGGAFGVATFNGASVRSIGSRYDGQANYNLYAFAPSTLISQSDTLLSAGVANFGNEPSAICSVFGVLPDGFSYNGLKIGGERGPSIPNATDASSTQARVNDLLTFLRAQGTIAP